MRKSTKIIQGQVNLGAAAVITALRQASKGDPIMAVAIAALASAALANAAGVSRAEALEAFELAWKQCEELR